MSLLLHKNSLAAWRSLNRTARTQAILAAYRASTCPLTDREVMASLGFHEMNAVRPRITELIEDGLVVEVYDVTDNATGRKVRACTNLK